MITILELVLELRPADENVMKIKYKATVAFMRRELLTFIRVWIPKSFFQFSCNGIVFINIVAPMQHSVSSSCITSS